MAAALTCSFTLSIAGDEAEAQGYQDAVPENLCTLVTQSDFDAAHAELQPLINAGHLKDYATTAIEASPCSALIGGMVKAVYDDWACYREILNAINAGFTDPLASYGMVNPWLVEAGGKAADQLVTNLVEKFIEWCAFLPQIDGDQDNGIKYILDFA